MANQIDLSKVSFPDVMDLRTAAIYLNLSEMRIRALARDGSLKASKDDHGMWEFHKADLDAFKSTPRPRKTGVVRGDGKLFVIRVKYADLADIKAVLQEYGIELQPRYDYAKMAAYKAKTAAAKAEAAKTTTK